MRGPDGHDDPPAGDPPADPPPSDPSLVNPPADPPADPPPADPPADEPVVVEPLTVEQLAVPEGFELQPELANEFLEIINGEMAPGDRANALMALHAKTIDAASEASSKAWETMQEEWKGEVKADSEIGGDKLQPTLNNIGRLLSEFGNDKVKEVFDFTGAGNNVHMIKFLNVIAEKLTEGKFFTASSPAGAESPDAAAKRLFPTSTN